MAGLDPGKKSDPAALVVLEQTEVDDPLFPGRRVWGYTLAGAVQYPLGTPYTTVAGVEGVGQLVCERFSRPPLAGSVVAVDATGVGEAVVDLLRSLRPSCVLVGVVITGGELFRQAGLCWHVAKSALVSNFVSLMHSGRFRVPASLPLKHVWDQQLAAFREKQSASGNLSWENDRPQDHDDLVLAAMIAAFMGERAPPYSARHIGRGRPAAAHAAPPGTFLPAGPGLGRPGRIPERW